MLEISELRVVATMHERKAMMGDLSDGFAALPGGLGTLEELFEVWTWAQLGLHAKPLSLLNVEGFYDTLLSHLDRAVADGFVLPTYVDVIHVASSPAELVADLVSRIAVGAAAPTPARDLR